MLEKAAAGGGRPKRDEQKIGGAYAAWSMSTRSIRRTEFAATHLTASPRSESKDELGTPRALSDHWK